MGDRKSSDINEDGELQTQDFKKDANRTNKLNSKIDHTQAKSPMELKFNSNKKRKTDIVKLP